MKNHWIKRKEDKDRAKITHHPMPSIRTFPHMLDNKSKRAIQKRYDKIVKDMMAEEDRKFLKAVDEALKSTPLSTRDVQDLYGNNSHCKCKSFKTNVGHTEECLKTLDRQ